MSNEIDLKQLQESKAALDQEIQKFKEAKAALLCVDSSGNILIKETLNNFQGLMNEVGYIIGSLQDRIDYLSERLYEHTSNGHLPPATGPAAMESALKALGWQNDFEVSKRYVYAGLNDGYVKVGGVKIN